MKSPLPTEALDDRLALVGRSGYGKTNAAKVMVEELLSSTARVCIIDPTDSWWGLRLKTDGERPAFPVAIFGGAKGDLPLNEHSGETVGAAIAASSQSCIVSMADFVGENARRRFAAAFLSALYAHNRETLHLVVDEADTLAPQKPIAPLDNEVLARMQQIVRRGRIRGFIPWLITQRPAVISKDVLSQADGLIAFNLTSSQDRDAIGGWIEGQADKSEERAILAQLPKLERGTAMVWIPGRGILKEVPFPLSRTFDSGRTPKRGETKRSATLKQIDVEGLRGRIAKVIEERKAKDPVELQKRVRELETENRQLKEAKPAAAAPITVNAKAEQVEAAFKRGTVAAERARHRQAKDVRKVVDRATGKVDGIIAALEDFKADLVTIGDQLSLVPEPVDVAPAPAPVPAPVARAASPPPLRRPPNGHQTEGISRPQQKILDALAWLESVRIERCDRTRAAMLADQSPKSSGFEKNVSTLSTKGLISYPAPGELQLTDDGRSAANAPASQPTSADLQASIASKISGPQWTLLEQLIQGYPVAFSREDLAKAANVSAASSGFEKNVSTLSGFGFVEYPVRGTVRATPICFVEG